MFFTKIFIDSKETHMRLMTIFLLTLTSLTLSSCATVNKEDCLKDMYHFGHLHGKKGSPQKYTDEIIDTCASEKFHPNIENYERGFMKGWEEYCLPMNAYKMGQQGDKYYSFCPPAREGMFREKYLLGKQYNELKDQQAEIEEKISDLKKELLENPDRSSDVFKLENYLKKIKTDIQKIEANAKKDNFYFTDPL